MNERTKDALTAGRFDAEEPRRLGQREPESRHFEEFRLNPRAEILFLAVCDAGDVHAAFGRLGHSRLLMNARRSRRERGQLISNGRAHADLPLFNEPNDVHWLGSVERIPPHWGIFRAVLNAPRIGFSAGRWLRLCNELGS